MVVTAVENRSSTTEDTIHGSRETRSDALHPARQGCSVRRFDQQMSVIVLERILDDAELHALGAHPQ